MLNFELPAPHSISHLSAGQAAVEIGVIPQPNTSSRSSGLHVEKEKSPQKVGIFSFTQVIRL
jgi:hypothetical protein